MYFPYIFCIYQLYLNIRSKDRFIKSSVKEINDVPFWLLRKIKPIWENYMVEYLP